MHDLHKKINLKLLCTLATLCLYLNPGSILAAEYSHEVTECAFAKKSWVEGKAIQCSQLIINEEGQNEAFRLPVVQLKSKQGAEDKAPIIFLQGGPGGIGIGPQEAVENWYNRALRDNHDILLIDLRGTGEATPRFCPELSMATLRTLAQDVAPQNEIARRVEQAKQCFDNLPFSGDAAALFTSRKSAEDINVLRELLGYEQLNIYSVSYGTRVALAFAEAYPDKLAGLVLDSVVPPDHGFYQNIPENFQNSLERLFSDCEKSVSCNEAFPEFRRDFHNMLEKLHESPLSIAMLNKDIAETGELIVNPQDFLLVVRQLMYGRDFLPILPLLVDEFKKGNVEPLALLFDLVVGNQARSINFATYYMVLGKEELSVPGGQKYRQQTRVGGPVPGITLFESDFELYRQAQSFFGESTSAIRATVKAPTLVLAGSYDPMTPPAYGKAVADNISGAHFIEYQSVGHAPSFADNCARSVVEEFFSGTTTPGFECVDAQEPVPFVSGLLLNSGLFNLVTTVYYEKTIIPLLLPMAMMLVYVLALVWCLWRLVVTAIRRKKAISRFNDDSKAKSLFFSGLFLGLAVLGVILWSLMQGIQLYGFISLVFGLPNQAWTLIPVVLLMVVVTALMVVYAKKAWTSRKWKLSGRIYFAGVILANAGLFGFLLRWGLF